ncbi:hypothetical protein [Achromobacter animicus]|uniref:hypothetical protein n=1 Tax=Achromobacter animicus TaxID=1389935 RepID=UPI001583FB34|nr:hypothetical protein [Achromobacter animicus]
MYLRLISTAVALAATSTVFGASVSAEDRKACSVSSSLGKTVMEARQAGMPMSELMDVFSKPGRADDGEFGRTLVEWAFEDPRYSTEEAKERAIRDFENEVYRACYQRAKERASQK